MASTLNADNGSISGSSGLKSSADASGVLALQTNGTTALTVDTSQNVGIGTSNPSFKLDVQSSAVSIIRTKGGTGSNQGGAFYITSAGSVNTLGAFGDYAAIIGGTPDQAMGIYTGANIPLVFNINNAERMRIDSSGSVVIAGTTVGTGMSGQFFVGAPATTGRQIALDGSNGAMFIQGNTGGWGTGLYAVGSSGTNRGGFGFLGGADGLSYYWVATAYNGTGVQLAYGGTSWSALSDIRDKEILGTIENALDKVSKIRPVYYKYKTDSEDQARRVGFIAQEVQAVLPESVTEIQREIDNPTEETKRLVLAYTETIPLLLASIQELKAEVDSLKAQLNK